MSKKDFSKDIKDISYIKPWGVDSVVGGGSKTKTAKKAKPVQSTTKEVRATFIVNEGKLEKIKSLARTEGILIKHILDKALEDLIKKWEAEHGKIKTFSKDIENKKLERLKKL